MRRQATHARQFSARIEHLEDRRVMSADPLGGLTDDVGHHDLVEEPPLEQTPVEQILQADPDFWINPADAALLDDSFYQEIGQALAEAHAQTGLVNVRNNYGFTGRGQTVAVIDSGIAYNHFALGGGLGANYRVVGGWDFTEENDADPNDDGAKGGHGTHVSGIIGSDSGSNTGVAPGVDFVGLRVFNDAGAGYFSWVENALRWIYDNRNTFENPITTVNLSLGVSNWNAATIPQWANLEDEFAQLESVGIFIAVSAGNSFGTFNTPGLTYPAASQYVVPVMSTDDTGALSYYSQRLARAIAAPGRNITSTIPDYKGNNNGIADDFAVMSGTSMAAPYIAGASVIIREAMELVGMTNITQDTIYDHMMATADTIYDAATKLSYKRLDLQAAIDALMPADDYGSTIAAAHNLGMLSGSSSVSGAIGALTDADYFRFTAAAGGNVSFDLTNSTGNMAAAWQVYDSSGQVVAAQNGDSLSFAVTAGQLYTVKLASAGGMGKYAFDVTAASTFSYADWGAVDYKQLSNLTVAGEAWYRVQTTRNGIFTVQADFEAAGGSVNLELYDANRQFVAAAATNNGEARVDVVAAAGTEFYVRVTGNSAAVDVKLVNLVSQIGNAVMAAGTDGADVFTYAAGDTTEVSVNGVEYRFSSATASEFYFTGGAGGDSITMTGATSADTVVLNSVQAAIRGDSYWAFAKGFKTVDVYGGGGNDDLSFFDTPGDDRLVIGQGFSTMTGSGLTYNAFDFATVGAYASQGNDVCEMYDSAGNDRFFGHAAASGMNGDGFRHYVAGFDTVYAHSTAGGYDVAELVDSPDDDVFTARPTYATLRSTGSFNSVHGFNVVHGLAINGGRDYAFLFDSAQNDVFIGGPDYGAMHGENFLNYAAHFESVRAHSTAGGNDSAWLAGSAGADAAIVRDGLTRLYGSGFDLTAQGFGRVSVSGAGGQDVARMQDLDQQDAVFGVASTATLTRGARRTAIEDFDHVIAMQLAGMAPSIDVRAVDYLFERI